MKNSIILGKKGEYWYVYNRVSGNPIIDSPIRSIKESITKYWSRKDKKSPFRAILSILSIKFPLKPDNETTKEENCKE